MNYLRIFQRQNAGRSKKKIFRKCKYLCVFARSFLFEIKKQLQVITALVGTSSCWAGLANLPIECTCKH